MAATTTWSFAEVAAAVPTDATPAAAPAPADAAAAVAPAVPTDAPATPAVPRAPSAALVRAISNPLLECPMCFMEHRNNLTVKFNPCEHAYCRGCTIQHMRTEMTPGSTGVKCPVCVDAPAEEAPAAGAASVAPADAGVGVAPTGSGGLRRTVTSIARGGKGELDELYLRRLFFWSNKHPDELPPGVRPISVEEAMRFMQVSASGGRQASAFPPCRRCQLVLLLLPAAAAAAAPACRSASPLPSRRLPLASGS